jgi:hypothetical protein
MLAVALVVLSGLSVVGFYGYVLLQFYRENQRSKFRTGFETDGEEDSDLCSTPTKRQKAYGQKSIRRETLINLLLGVSWLAGLFLEIELLNSLVAVGH